MSRAGLGHHQPTYARTEPRSGLVQLLQNRVSDNVGGVKFILSTPWRALMEERHFALAGWFVLCQPRLAS